MKKVLFILASKDFRDSEYFVPAQILKSAGHQMTLASDTDAGKTAQGADGNETIVDLNISNVDIKNFDAVVFIGGPGTLKHLDNETSYNIARQTLESGKLLSAICIAPVILAKAGVLNGKKATVWTNEMDKNATKILTENGAKFINASVVKDEIITANGPDAAEEFGDALKQALWQSTV